MLQYVAENSKEYIVNYGNVATQTVGTIQRALLKLEEQGGEYFFGEPEIDINDFIKFDSQGRGNINILHSVDLYKQPTLYASFLLWLLTTINDKLPEEGDLEKPKLVFFFDEAHLLFNELPDYMLTQVTQIVKLIRSKGVGLYFISQSPNDIPKDIMAQLGNKVQHTLRAYTPADQKGIKAIADSFRTNQKFDTAEAILSLGTGEGVISFLNEKGEPNIVERATILPPQSMMGTIDDSVRLMVMARSELKGKYDTEVDRESAYEVISQRMEEEKAAEEEAKRLEEERKAEEKRLKEEEKQKKEEEKQKRQEEREKKAAEKEAEAARKKTLGYKVEKAASRTANSALNSLGRKVAKEIFKNIFKK